MNKDIIYIDVEDDVTSIIQKVKNSNQKIVALVPPKNIGALQSAVNLRLLQKAAGGANKRIVLITNNTGLRNLAAGVKVPVAKNLQSKPEVPEEVTSAASDPEDDIIKGEELPVGELAATAAGGAAAAALASETPVAAAKNADDIEISGGDLPNLDNEAALPVAAAAAGAKGPASKLKPKRGQKVPNFDRFRKWIFIGGGALLLIILFFVFANIVWAGANVVITARTSNMPVNLSLTLSSTQATDPDTGILKSVTKQLQKTATVTFTPTGSQTVGTKAKGSVVFSNCETDTAQTIAAGTVLTDNHGNQYTLDSDTPVPPGQGSFFSGCTQAGKSNAASITANDVGSDYNDNSGTKFTVAGHAASMSATASTDISGGDSHQATVVSSADVTTATSKLATSDATAAKAQLTQEFGSGYVILSDSFTTDNGTPTSSPAVGAEATSAQLSRQSTYTLTGVSKDQIKILTTNYLSSQIDSKSQKIYDDGSSTATISQFLTSPDGVQTAHIKTTGKIGPQIDENALKQQLVGQKTEAIRSQIQSIDGVQNVDVSLSPFWRTTAPSADKIKISFVLNSGNGQ